MENVEIDTPGASLCETYSHLTGAERMNKPETASRGRATRLTAEHVAARALVESETLAQAAGRVLLALCQGLGWDYGALWNVNAEEDALRCVETCHLPSAHVPEFEAASRGTTFARGVGLPGRVWESSEPIWIPDVVSDPNFPRAAIAAQEGLHGAFGL